MYFERAVIDAVDRVAIVQYLNQEGCVAWNRYRKEGELRLLTGWVWTSRVDGTQQQGFKTVSACYRDAYYVLIKNRAQPQIARNKLLRAVA